MTDFGEAVTGRLRCRRPAANAIALYRELFADPEVNRWLRPSPLHPFADEEVDRLFRHDRGHWQKYGYGPWVLLERESGAFVGRGGLAWTLVEGEPEVELPWALLARFHRRGYATEQALAAIGVARTFGIERLVSLTLPGNRASRRVMEKSGLVLVGEVQHIGLPHVLYELDLA